MKRILINENINSGFLNSELNNLLRDPLDKINYLIFEENDLPALCKKIQNDLSKIDSKLKVSDYRINGNDEEDVNGISVALQILYGSHILAVFDDFDEPKFFNGKEIVLDKNVYNNKNIKKFSTDIEAKNKPVTEIPCVSHEVNKCTHFNNLLYKGYTYDGIKQLKRNVNSGKKRYNENVELEEIGNGSVYQSDMNKEYYYINNKEVDASNFNLFSGYVTSNGNKLFKNDLIVDENNNMYRIDFIIIGGNGKIDKIKWIAVPYNYIFATDMKNIDGGFFPTSCLSDEEVNQRLAEYHSRETVPLDKLIKNNSIIMAGNIVLQELLTPEY